MLRNATRVARRGGWLAIALLAAICAGPAAPAVARQSPKVPQPGDKKWLGPCAQGCFDACITARNGMAL